MRKPLPTLLSLLIGWMLLLVPHAATAVTAPPKPARAAGVAYGSALPRFALFGWVSPPANFTTAARYQELAATGFNLTVLAWDDSGTVTQNHQRLDLIRNLGVGALLLDNDLDSVFIARPETWPLVDQIVSRYRDDPAFAGYYLGDEPPESYFPRLGEWFELLRQRDPAHPAWNALGPRGAYLDTITFRQYVQAYADATHPAVLCNNQYDFSNIFGDLHRLTENVAVMGAVARSEGIPFWGIVNLVEHWVFRHVTEGMLRWQVARWIAGGATGIGYFTYWTPAPNAEYNWQPAMITWGTGLQAPAYTTVTELNRRLAPIGNRLAGMHWDRVQGTGWLEPGGIAFTPDSVITAVQGHATLGRFTDSTGTPVVFLANPDSASARTLTLTLAAERYATRLRDDGSVWDLQAMTPSRSISIPLAAGDFVLLRLPQSTQPLAADPPSRPSLRLLASPNPASRGIRFELQGGQRLAQLEVVDVQGRVVWQHLLQPGVTLRWDGQRENGTPLESGVYFARVDDGVERCTQRWVWLGAH